MVLEGKEIEVYQCLNFIKSRATLIERMNSEEPVLDEVVDEIKKSLRHGYPKAIHTTKYYEVAFLIKAYLKYSERLNAVDEFHNYFKKCLDEVIPNLKFRINFQVNKELPRLVELLRMSGSDKFVAVHPEYHKKFTKLWLRIWANDHTVNVVCNNIRVASKTIDTKEVF